MKRKSGYRLHRPRRLKRVREMQFLPIKFDYLNDPRPHVVYAMPEMNIIESSYVPPGSAILYSQLCKHCGKHMFSPEPCLRNPTGKHEANSAMLTGLG